MNLTKYVLAAIFVAIISHVVFIHAAPRVLMNIAMTRLAASSPNAWRVADRVTPLSRSIVRPSPDFAYSACVYDLSNGPVRIQVTPWSAYWSLSLYAANSDNYFVLDDREARNGATILLTRRPPRAAEDTSAITVVSPSTRGVALIRRLAPTLESYNGAARVAQADVCGGTS